MKKLLLLLFFVSPLFANAQHQHELKFDGFGALYNYVHVNHEYLLANKFGIQTDFLYSWEELSFFTVESGTFDSQQFDAQFFILKTGGKFYLFPQKKADRLSIGLFLLGKVLTSKEAGYEEAFSAAFGSEPTAKDYNRFSLGSSIGYKWLIKEKFVLEPEYFFDLNLIDISNALSLEGYIALNFGYRF